MKTVLTALIFLGSVNLAGADGQAFKCKNMNRNKQIECLENMIADLDAKLTAVLQTEMQKANDRIGGLKTEFDSDYNNRFLAYGAKVTIQSQRNNPPLTESKCLDLATQGEEALHGWRCNNDNNHGAQHWLLNRPN